jgi:hypothetical protein
MAIFKQLTPILAVSNKTENIADNLQITGNFVSVCSHICH